MWFLHGQILTISRVLLKEGGASQYPFMGSSVPFVVSTTPRAGPVRGKSSPSSALLARPWAKGPAPSAASVHRPSESFTRLSGREWGQLGSGLLRE